MAEDGHGGEVTLLRLLKVRDPPRVFGAFGRILAKSLSPSPNDRRARVASAVFPLTFPFLPPRAGVRSGPHRARHFPRGGHELLPLSTEAVVGSRSGLVGQVRAREIARRARRRLERPLSPSRCGAFGERRRLCVEKRDADSGRGVSVRFRKSDFKRRRIPRRLAGVCRGSAARAPRRGGRARARKRFAQIFQKK